MNEPVRLRDGDGAAGRLMVGAALNVPSDARRRAVAFTSAAATIGASATAVAATATSVVKSFVLCVALGAVGGGVMSLAASETVARFDTKSEGQARPAARSTDPPGAQPSPPLTPELVAAETPLAVAAPPVVDAVVRDASSKARSFAQDEAAAPSVEARAPAGGQPSLFQEQRIIDSVRATVARGDFRAAASQLDDYERGYTIKQFWPEALALRIETLRGSGQLDAARRLAADFARNYPHHPLLERVQSSVAK